jgi:hypothetical protein
LKSRSSKIKTAARWHSTIIFDFEIQFVVVAVSRIKFKNGRESGDIVTSGGTKETPGSSVVKEYHNDTMVAFLCFYISF